MLNKKKNNKGFTLVELLVVIAIIGILAVVAVPALFKNIEKGKVADLEADISAIRSAALSHYADNGDYPNEIVAGVDPKLDGIIKQIESLSNPFGAEYEVGDADADTADKIAPPENLELKITTTKLSDAGFKKLQSDLGDMVTAGSSKGDITVIIINGED